jgi:hypothetical protein
VPSPLDVVFSIKPVLDCLAVTTAPGTTAPVASVTVPPMLPYPWAIAPLGTSKTTAQTTTILLISLRKVFILAS